MRFGAIHAPRPDAIARLSARGALTEAPIPNWFARFPADGDPLGNDDIGNCVDAADCQIVRLMGGRANRQMAMARYAMMTGFDPATGQPDNGSDTSADMVNWCAAPIVDLDGRPFPIYWASVGHTDMAGVGGALARFPLVVTIGLPNQIAQYPERWREPPYPGWTADEPHRVVLGNRTGAGWWLRSWGLDYPTHPDLLRLMLLAVDVPIPHPAAVPPELQWAGLDYAALAADLATISA